MLGCWGVGVRVWCVFVLVCLRLCEFVGLFVFLGLWISGLVRLWVRVVGLFVGVSVGLCTRVFTCF